MNRKTAFTLIELLVVIAIIAILAAILFPVFAQAKVAAKKTQTISNLKNINTGFQLYLADYDDFYPIATKDADNQGFGAFDLRNLFPSLVDPYIKNGVVGATGELKDIWADPLTKPLMSTPIRNTFAYNIYGLGGFSFACFKTFPTPAETTTCTTRAASTWGVFADTKYNRPASGTELAEPARTLVLVTGEQFARAPQFGIVNPTGGQSVGVYGNSGDGGDFLLQNTFALSTVDRLVRLKLMVGGNAIVAYGDGHVKLVANSTLWSNRFSSNDGKWRGGVADGPAMNNGWSREWITP